MPDAEGSFRELIIDTLAFSAAKPGQSTKIGVVAGLQHLDAVARSSTHRPGDLFHEPRIRHRKVANHLDVILA